MAGAARTYMICATQRSGSTLLCEALQATGVAGQPDEYFDPDTMQGLTEAWNTTDSRRYLERLQHQRSSPNGVFGVKAMYPDLMQFLDSTHSDNTPSAISAQVSELLSGVRHIWITRRNRVRQAISYWRAIQTEQWTSREQRSVDRAENYSFERIADLRNYVIDCDRDWQQYLSTIRSEPFVVVYEDFIAEYRRTVAAVLRYLELPAVSISAQPPLRKQSDAKSDRWAEQFLNEERSISRLQLS